MKEKSINFSAEMARAVWEGRKTQMMRIIKPQPTALPLLWWPGGPESKGSRCYLDEDHFKNGARLYAPYQPGGRLWGRDPWRTAKCFDGMTVNEIEKACLRQGYKKAWTPILYEADKSTNGVDILEDGWSGWGELREARSMPRWASRMTLEVEEVSVMRVQDISEGEIIDEGCPKEFLLGKNWFAPLWNSLYGPGAWDRNDWCWKIKFRRIHEND